MPGKINLSKAAKNVTDLLDRELRERRTETAGLNVHTRTRVIPSMRHLLRQIRTACGSLMRETGVDRHSNLNTSVRVLGRVRRYTLTAELTG